MRCSAKSRSTACRRRKSRARLRRNREPSCRAPRCPARRARERGRAATPEIAVMAAREAARSAASLEELRGILSKFEGCALRTTAKQLVFADGNPQARVMFVGEAPGREEDLEGLPFVGRSGKLLDLMMTAIGLDRTSAYIANIIPWRPPGNRTPTPQESQICLPFIQRQIELANPDILVCLGGPSAQTLLGVKEGIKRTRGRWFSFPHRHARDPRHRDLPSGLSVALAAGEAFRVAGFPRDQESAWRGLRPYPAEPSDFLSLIEACSSGVPSNGLRSRPSRPHPVRVHDLVSHHLPELHDRARGLHRDLARRCGCAPARIAISCSRGSGPRSSPSRSAWASCRGSCCPTSSAPTGAASRS